MSAKQSADARRDPIPLLFCGYLVSAMIGLFSFWGVLDAAGAWEKGSIPSGGAGWLFFAGIAIVAQLVSNVAALAVRRAKALGELNTTHGWMIFASGVFGLISAVALHNAFERAAIPIDPALLWAVCAALPVSELAIYWADEALKSRAREIVEAESDAELSALRAPPTFADVLSLEPAGLELVRDPAFLRELRGRLMSLGAKATHRIAALDANAARPKADAVKVISRK